MSSQLVLAERVCGIENNDYIIKEGAVVSEIDGVKTTPNNPDPTQSVPNDTRTF